MYRIPLIKPHITDDIKARVCAVLDSGYLTEGPVTREPASVVSIFGNPLDDDRQNEIRARHHVPILEDTACSICGTDRDRKTGDGIDISMFNLHPCKSIMTGDGDDLFYKV